MAVQTLQAWVAAARQALRLERHAQAAQAFDHALQALGSPTAGEADATVLLHGELMAGRAAALFALGRPQGVEAPLRATLGTVEGVCTHAASPRALAIAAALRFELGRLLTRQRRLHEALPLLEAAQAELASPVAPLLAMRIQGFLGSTRAMAGDPVAGLRHLDRALEMAQVPELAAHVREHATLTYNRGIALSELGRYREAAAALEQAQSQLEGLLSSQPAEARAELARLRRNMGFVQARAGDTAAAITHLRAAAQGFDALLRRPGALQHAALWRASRTATQMNLGYSLFVHGELDESALWLRRAAAGYARLVREQPALREDQARNWVNQAHGQAARGRPARAAALYTRGASVFQALVAEGRRHCESDLINAHLGLARVRLRQARVAESAALFESALPALAQMTHQGQLQHAQAWLAAWQWQMAEWLALAARLPDAGRLLVDAMVRVAVHPPTRPSSDGAEPIEALLQAAERLPEWAQAAPAGGEPASQFQRLAAAYLGWLLDAAAGLLADADPAWLQAQAGGMNRLLGRLRDAAAASADASRSLAEWFLCTHGLRAQRLALAQDAEPRVVALRDMLQQRHALEQAMLGERATPPAGGPEHRQQLSTLLGPGAEPSAYVQRRIEEWASLRQRIETLRRELVQGGLLPDQQRLTLERVAACLQPQAQLLLLARVDKRRLLLVSLRVRVSGELAAGHRHVVLDDALAAFDCGDLHHLARLALAHRSGRALRQAPAEADDRASPGLMEDGDHFALHMYRKLWHQALAEPLAQGGEAGLQTLHLVPADDLHRVPWNHLAHEAGRSVPVLHVYPSAAAWLGCQQPAGTPGAGERPLRWLLAAGTAKAGSQPLPWVEVEHHLSCRLWGEAATELQTERGQRPSAHGVDVLLGMGHGGCPDGNPALAGLALDHGLLVAHDLPRLRVCRRVLLSACVLGLTEETHGEPLGFLSACFDYQASFAGGWLTEVPDQAACLFSIAAQWALRAAHSKAAPGRPVSWAAVLGGVRRELAQGRWPAGLADWLQLEWAGMPACPPAGLGSPPELLLRALPWWVSLGG